MRWADELKLAEGASLREELLETKSSPSPKDTLKYRERFYKTSNVNWKAVHNIISD